MYGKLKKTNFLLFHNPSDTRNEYMERTAYHPEILDIKMYTLAEWDFE